MSNIIQIPDFNSPDLDLYARMSENQLRHIYEPDEGLFIAESPKVIMRALDAGYTPVSILAEQKQLKGEVTEIICRCGDIPVFVAESDVITKLTGFALTRGLLCAMKRRPHPDVASVCDRARKIAILENVVNPTNVGAIFRSAAALGIDAILLTNSCSDPLYRRAARVAMGTVFQIPWTYADSPVACVKGIGFKTAAMALTDKSVSIDDAVLMSENKIAIVLGNEESGLMPETISECDYTVRIPMYHGVDSLNVAAASAVAFWQLRNSGK